VSSKERFVKTSYNPGKGSPSTPSSPSGDSLQGDPSPLLSSSRRKEVLLPEPSGVASPAHRSLLFESPYPVEKAASYKEEHL